MSIAQDLVAARLYESEDAVMNDALRHLLRARPDLRISLAVYRLPAARTLPGECSGTRWR